MFLLVFFIGYLCFLSYVNYFIFIVIILVRFYFFFSKQVPIPLLSSFYRLYVFSLQLC